MKVSNAVKHDENPFVKGGYLEIEKGKKATIVGSTNKILVDRNTGETEGITLIHKYTEVDKDQFVKLFIGEIKALFNLSRSGLKVFGYVLSCLRINEGTIYFNIPDLMEYCGYKSSKAAYKGLGELVANDIVALSTKPNLIFINPNIIFNGNRIAFMNEYRLRSPSGEQSKTLPPPAPKGEQI